MYSSTVDGRCWLVETGVDEHHDGHIAAYSVKPFVGILHNPEGMASSRTHQQAGLGIRHLAEQNSDD